LETNHLATLNRNRQPIFFLRLKDVVQGIGVTAAYLIGMYFKVSMLSIKIFQTLSDELELVEGFLANISATCFT
jgi:hypothetical protein